MGTKMSAEEVAQADVVVVLEQRRWWKSQSGEVVRRRDMNIDHKLNTMAYLLRSARKIAEEYANRPEFTDAPDGVFNSLESNASEPERWMMRTPMFRALLADVMSFADIGPEDLGMVQASTLDNAGPEAVTALLIPRSSVAWVQR